MFSLQPRSQSLRRGASMGALRPHLLLLAALCLIMHASAQGLGTPSQPPNVSTTEPVAAPGANPAQAGNDSGVLQDLEFLRLNVLEFWARHGLDNEFGGIHGTLDRAGAAISPPSKGLIQQARHIW
jgi:hypothetical protein